MKLRRQLLLVSLLLLTLPWAGCQYVREMESALQSGQEQALLARTLALATTLDDKPQLLYPDLRRWHSEGNGDSIYASRASAPIILDGYGDGWNEEIQAEFGPVRYRAVTRGPLLYLFIEVDDEQVNYHDPTENRRPSGDHLVLRTGDNRDYLIATAAPGPVQGRYLVPGSSMGWEPRIRGHWQDSLEGYSIELEIPLSLLRNKLGFYVANGATSHGNISPRRRTPPWLIYRPEQLQSALAPFAEQGLEIRVTDTRGWVIGVINMPADLQEPVIQPGPEKRDSEATMETTPWLLRALYRAILTEAPLELTQDLQPGKLGGEQIEAALAGEPNARWFGLAEQPGRKLLRAAAPVRIGGEVAAVVVTEQDSEQYLSLTDRAFNRLLYYSLGAMFVSAAGLLGYASWLSWRIRRLSRATIQAVREDGSIDRSFRSSSSSDEIGELSRSYADLLERLGEYTDYLRGLSRKLSHELRTPIAVIRSSLDNLEQDSEQHEVYLQRAREGLNRLGNILTAMAEASRVEESVHKNQPERFDLVPLLRELAEAYRGIYPKHELSLDLQLDRCPIEGVPDLIAQMLDKLMDNAAGFCPPGGRIELRLRGNSEGIELSLSNEGPALPEHMQQQIFDSMVSIREHSDEVHLGLGLHIVRLIADYHGAGLQARNLDDGSGVCFRVTLPSEYA